MAVNSWDQTASKLDAFTEAVKLRHIITQMILRDFGLKRDKQTTLVSQITRDNYPELKPTFDLMDEYIDKVQGAELLKEYDDEFVRYIRQNLFRYASDLVSYIAAANEIKCQIPEEFKKRILLQDDAIGDIAKIRQDVLYIEEFFGVDLSRYMEYSEQLENTKGYLYRWKKSTIRDYDEFLHPEKKAARLEKEKSRRSRRKRSQ